MFPDPQVITVNAVAKSMPRIASVGQKSTYSTNDQTFTLNISHVVAKDRLRSMARVDQKAIVLDPISEENDWDTLSVYLVIDRPLAGFTSSQVDQLIAGFKTWLDTTATGRLFGQES